MKRGVAGGTIKQVKNLGCDWSYTWQLSPDRYNLDYQHVPMIWGKTYDKTMVETMASRIKFPYWLIWNEPDAPQSWGQSYIKAEEAAKLYKSIYESITRTRPNKLIIGGLAFVDTQWPIKFRAAYKALYGVYPTVHGYAVHQYAQGVNYNAMNWRTTLQNFYNWQKGNGGGEFWLTEWGCLNNTTLAEKVMNDQLAWLDTQTFVTRYAWFSSQTTNNFTGSLYSTDGIALTKLGNMYKVGE